MDDTTNINTFFFDKEGGNQISLVKIILVFYILVGSSLLVPLFSRQWKDTLENNRMAQHMVGLTTMIALVALLNNGKLTNVAVIIYGLLGYLLFILSTKMDIHWSVIIVILLLVAYMYENSNELRNYQIDTDNALTDDEKKRIKKSNSSWILYISSGIMVVILVSVYLYSQKKMEQYGGGQFDLVKFLLY